MARTGRLGQNLITALLAGIRRTARELGATVERDDAGYQICAPTGKRFADGATHAVAIRYDSSWPSEWRQSSLQEGWRRIHGAKLIDCPADCECRGDVDPTPAA